MKLLQSLFLIVTLFCSFSVYAEKININTATAEQISTTMSGIGDSKARAIVEYRKNHGRFESIEALKGVDGVGMKTIEKNRDKITL